MEHELDVQARGRGVHANPRRTQDRLPFLLTSRRVRLRAPATSLRNIGPGCTKQYGADVHLRIDSVVAFLDDVAEQKHMLDPRRDREMSSSGAPRC